MKDCHIWLWKSLHETRVAQLCKREPVAPWVERP